MPNDTMYNPNNYEIQADDIVINGVSYICKDWSENPSVNKISATNSDGSHRGNAYTAGETTASCTIEKVKADDATPTRWQKVQHNGKSWILANITRSGSQGAVVSYSCEFDLDMSTGA